MWSPEEPSRAFRRTTIRTLGHDESFLEDRLVEHPDLLGLDSLGSGIGGPYRVFQQISLTTPTDRQVFPDIVLVSKSAHLIVVEVKLEDNPELVNRSVIGQVVEYSASAAVLDRDGLVGLLSGNESASSLEGLAKEWFPDLPDHGEFAELLFERCSRGDIDLVVACDRCPAGLEDLGVGLDRQSALAFRLQVVEIEPWVSPDLPDRILFLNRARVRTEIVGRTLVEVSWKGPEATPDVKVTTTSLEEVQEAMDAAQKEKRAWTAADIRQCIETSEEVRDEERDLLLKLLEFSVEHSYAQEITGHRTVHPTFCFKVNARATEGKRRVRVLWSVQTTGRYLWVFRKGLQAVLPSERVVQVEEQIRSMFDEPLNAGTDYITVPQALLRERFEDFERLFLEIKGEVEGG